MRRRFRKEDGRKKGRKVREVRKLIFTYKINNIIWHLKN